jgi:tetratricopeptide (TPR) repeat protein
MKDQTDAPLSQVYKFLEAGNPGSAKQMVENALSEDLEDEEVIFALRCVNFWIGKIPVPDGIDDLDAYFDAGESLIYQWKQFVSFAGEKQKKYERIMSATCRGVFSVALDCYEQALISHQMPQKSDIHRRIGLCCKKLGAYESALSHLAEANKSTPDQPEILAEMADCYALCGNERTARVLFREAFFLEASKIEISFLESEMIRTLIDEIERMGFSGPTLLEWIPVYGVLYGIFTVKRELRSHEMGKLRNQILSLETALKETGSDPAIIKPKLLNHYFWFIDHLIAQKEDRAKIDETLLKIKLLDADVHKKYTGVKPA